MALCEGEGAGVRENMLKFILLNSYLTLNKS